MWCQRVFSSIPELGYNIDDWLQKTHFTVEVYPHTHTRCMMQFGMTDCAVVSLVCNVLIGRTPAAAGKHAVCSFMVNSNSVPININFFFLFRVEITICSVFASKNKKIKSVS
jgi:hypothetical protein